jgi:hypothetical protein
MLSYQKILFSACCFLFMNNSYAIKNQFSERVDNESVSPFYVGLISGYGTTTWGNLVSQNQNAAMLFSTPTKVSEGGLIAGVYAGYELNPSFALETSYVHYQNAKINFDEMSLFTFEHNGITDIISRTETVSFSGKLMAFIPHTLARAYTSVGATFLHRNDSIRDWWRLRPSFDLGVNYPLTHHVMLELGGDYTAGYGESELDPVEHYVPFLYSAYVRLAYRF